MYGAWAAFCIRWCTVTHPSLPWPSYRRCTPLQIRDTASPLTPSRMLLWQTPSSAAWTEAPGPASRCRYACLPTSQLPASLCNLPKQIAVLLDNARITLKLHLSNWTRNASQDLLDHPFLRPTEGPAGPAPGQVGLTRDQLKKLLTQVGHSNVPWPNRSYTLLALWATVVVRLEYRACCRTSLACPTSIHLSMRDNTLMLLNTTTFFCAY